MFLALIKGLREEGDSKNSLCCPRASRADSTNQSSLNQNIPLEKLKELRLDNPKNLTFSYLNINSVRNKFDSLQEIVMGKVDTLIVAETKIDASFPTAQFSAEGYHKPYRLDVSEKTGGILVYVNS